MENNSVYTKIIDNLSFLKSKESLSIIDETLNQVNRDSLSFVDGFYLYTEKLMENIVLYGNSGVGKTHLATAIGMTACQNRYSTYFIKCSDLMESLHKAHIEGRLPERLKKLSGYKLLIIDELGYLPITKDDAKLFFQLIDRRYERNSTIITTNINFSQWDDIFGDPMIASAIVDRLLHHATVVPIKGKSFRLAKIYADAEDEL